MASLYAREYNCDLFERVRLSWRAICTRLTLKYLDLEQVCTVLASCSRLRLAQLAPVSVSVSVCLFICVCVPVHAEVNSVSCFWSVRAALDYAFNNFLSFFLSSFFTDNSLSICARLARLHLLAHSLTHPLTHTLTHSFNHLLARSDAISAQHSKH